MAGTTPTLQLPYPVADDTVDVPRDIKALADKIDPLGVVPVGAMMLWIAAVSPAGWLLCQGQLVSATAYPQLATLLGQSGGNVTIPNLASRIPLGASATYPLNTNGGAATVALTPAQTAIKNHTHSGTTGNENSSLSHSHLPAYVGGGNQNRYALSKAGDVLPQPPGQPGTGSWNWPQYQGDSTEWGGPSPHTHNFSTSNPAGGEVNGSAHENLPPYLAVNYIIRAG